MEIFVGLSVLPGYALVDTGAQHGVVGLKAYHQLVDQLARHRLKPRLVETLPMQAAGVGGTTTFLFSAEVPVGIDGTSGLLTVHVIEVIVLKLLWVLHSVGIKMATQVVLGKEAFKRIFQQHKKSLEKPRMEILQVINGEIVGKPLPPSTGTWEVDPATCQHDRMHLKRRGNKNSGWWTCIACNSRWERKSVDEIHQDVQGKDTDLVGFGAHANKTYRQVYETEKGYCRWVLMTAEVVEEWSPALARVAKDLVKKESQEAAQASSAAQRTEAEEYTIMSDSSLHSGASS
jgi:hypothetical protein